MQIELNYYPLDMAVSTVSTPTPVTTLDASTTEHTTTDTVATNTPPAPNAESNLTPTGGGTIMAGGNLQSQNYAQGQSGWIIKSDGDVELNAGTFRGSLAANSINIPNTTSANSFHTDSNGNSWWGSNSLATAVASILNTGQATFTNIIATGETAVTEQTTTNDLSSTTISPGDAVALASSNVNGNATDITTQTSHNTTSGNLTLNTGYGQVFTTTSKANAIVTIKFMGYSNIGVAPANFKVYLFATSGGLPTGASLGSVIVNVGSMSAGVAVELTATFASPIAVSPSTQYAFVIYDNDNNGFIQIRYQNSNVYSGGTLISTGNGGTTYTADANSDAYFKITERQLSITAGYVYKTNGTVAQLTSGFIGFAVDTIAPSSTGRVNSSSLYTHKTGLTVGSDYYVSDTPGAIATSAGTNTKKVGRALTTTTILVDLFL